MFFEGEGLEESDVVAFIDSVKVLYGDKIQVDPVADCAGVQAK